MNQAENQRAPWWLTIQLWGLDAPVTALCWAGAYIAFLELPMVPAAPLLLLAAFAWLANTTMLPAGALMQIQGTSRRFFALKNMLKLAVALLAAWGLFYGVVKLFLAFAAIPIAMQAVAHVPYMGRIAGWRAAFLSLAFALACSVPAAYSCITVPAHALFACKPTWYLAMLIYLHYLVRSSWLLDERTARRRCVLVSLGLALLVVSCLLGAGEAYAFERSLYLTLALAAAALELQVWLRPRLGEDALFSLDWLTTALPAVLGMMLWG